MVVAPHAEGAVTCGMIASKLAGCIGYLTSPAAVPSAACCAGIKAVKAAAATPADRKTACGCLKTASGAMKGLNYAKAGGLPGKCGVSIPYTISPSTNCNAVH
ncbi:hypothetical protein GPK41_09345 [Bifidobacterium adolescentis]|uniref:non-specific lipid-transfer protein n=1 Tax=Bifidobacterium adolescentis TaxID=1680 RepID=UPI001EBCB3C1|nr:hypothetical protein [Bifidobacterium adolescentis]